MTKMRRRFTTRWLGALGVILGAGAGSHVLARQGTADDAFSLAYLCVNFAGSEISAPEWRPGPDGAGSQQLLIQFKGDQSISSFAWYMDDAAYYEGSGIGVSMTAGFAIVAFASDFVDTYVYNSGTTELFFSSVRSGNVVFPNTVKALRGTCKPAGSVGRPESRE